MIKSYLHKIKRSFENKAIVLMYHRVANPNTDVWDINVTPENFAAHLKVLKSTYNVVSLPELVAGIEKKKIKRKSIAITFDDGYADNFFAAMPLLIQHHLPATFFIASGFIGGNFSFWWDTLEKIILKTEQLPASLTIELNQKVYSFSFLKEVRMNKELHYKHKYWKASFAPPPTQRAAIYFEIWEQLRTMEYDQLYNKLRYIKEWAAVDLTDDPNDCSMSLDQLEQLSRNALFSIGAHTVSHPALSYHTEEVQRLELQNSKNFLKKHTGKEIELLAYPYGNYNEQTLQIAGELNFKAAFTTEEKLIKNKSNPMRLARYQVKDWNVVDFKNQLAQWIL